MSISCLIIFLKIPGRWAQSTPWGAVPRPWPRQTVEGEGPKSLRKCHRSSPAFLGAPTELLHLLVSMGQENINNIS